MGGNVSLVRELTSILLRAAGESHSGIGRRNVWVGRDGECEVPNIFNALRFN